MTKRFHILLLTLCVSTASAAVMAQQADDPLAQFRSNNQTGTQPAQNNNTLPAPTMGGMQEQGLSQEQINQALQNYNFDGGLSLEEQQAETERMAREAAFEATLNGAFPLNPEEIREVLDIFRDVREARESRIGGAPEPEITLETIPLDPGSIPPIIQLSPNYVTTLNIVDVTGQPWPIQDMSWGGNFEILQPEQGSNIVRISPMRAHEVGNLSVRLLDFQTPVIFSLRSDIESVDVRFDAQIPEYGPYAEMPIIETQQITTTAGGEEIIRILDGTPPANSQKLDIDGVDGRTSVYDVGGQIYVRTPLTLLSPGWSSSVKSADGTTVYAIGQSPVLLLSDRGKMVRAIVEYN